MVVEPMPKNHSRKTKSVGKVIFHVRVKPKGYEVVSTTLPDKYLIADFIGVTGLDRWMQEMYMRKIERAILDTQNPLHLYEELYNALKQRAHQIEGLHYQMNEWPAKKCLLNLADIIRSTVYEKQTKNLFSNSK